MIASRRLGKSVELEAVKMAALVVGGIGSMVLAAEVLDISTALIVALDADMLRGKLLSILPYASGTLYATIAFLMARSGSQGLYATLIGLTVSLFVIYNFRSFFIRPGTFDLFEDSKGRWLVPLFVGLVLGSLAGLVFRRRHAKGTIALWIWVLPIVLLLWSFVVWVLKSSASLAANWSDFPQTRHFALGSIAIILAAVLTYGRFRNRKDVSG